jgi:prevent-host-death family protein
LSRTPGSFAVGEHDAGFFQRVLDGGEGACLERCAIEIDKVASSGYLTGMRSVGLKVLKNKLSEYIRLAASGEAVLVTDRNRVVAEIVPPQPGRQLDLTKEDILTRGIREGWITPAKNPSTKPLPRKPVMSFEELMKDLDESREDRDLP